jgi:hypothetical protein
MLSYRRGWIEWRDRKPVRKIIGRPVDGFVSPMRFQLPDNDKSQWPKDSKGVPQDPWQENFWIIGRDLTDGRLCTFNTTSWYGSKAVGKLLGTYIREQQNHSGLMPVVLLSSETKPTTNFGPVEAPVFTIVDWRPFGEGAAPPGMRLPQPELPKTQVLLAPPAKAPVADEMSDEIPF